MTDEAVTYGDLRRGDWFRSPRKAEGWVQVVCPFGTCKHDERDIFSCHIRQWNEFHEEVQYFVLADPRDEAVVGTKVLERLGLL